MRVLPLILLVCSLILSAGTLAASPAKKDALSSADVQQTANAPVQKKVPRTGKPKTDDAMVQAADPSPGAVRDKSGRFVKKESPLPMPEQKSVPVQVPPKDPKSASPSAMMPNTAEPGATAQCKDGTFSHSKQHSGSCSRHGGVAQWLAQ